MISVYVFASRLLHVQYSRIHCTCNLILVPGYEANAIYNACHDHYGSCLTSQLTSTQGVGWLVRLVCDLHGSCAAYD